MGRVSRRGPSRSHDTKEKIPEKRKIAERESLAALLHELAYGYPPGLFPRFVRVVGSVRRDKLSDLQTSEDSVIVDTDGFWAAKVLETLEQDCAAHLRRRDMENKK